MADDQYRRPPTDAGTVVPSDEHSLTVGAGPVDLAASQGHDLVQQLANFNRERITESQLHARAAVFQPGTKTGRLTSPTSLSGASMN